MGYEYLSFDHIRSEPVVTSSGHARPYDETLAWLLPKLPLIPITRLVNLTPLDYLGFPVWQAITPLNRDLTVHSGKGLTDDAAKLSAIMEAIERTCAQGFDDGRTIRASYRELFPDRHKVDVLDPRICSLPYNSTYSPEKQYTWVEGIDLLTRRRVFVPSDLVLAAPPGEGIWSDVETNGLASGNTHLEAIVHGLNEIIERDATMRLTFACAAADPHVWGVHRDRVVDSTTLPKVAANWIERLSREDGRVTIIDETSDIGIPAYSAFYLDLNFPWETYVGNLVFKGRGCDVSPTRAVMRALSEAVQGHAGLTSGARDTYEAETRPSFDGRRLRAHYTFGVGKRPLRPEPAFDDLLSILEHTLDKLRAAGFEHCICVDASREEIGVPVVRVLLPGATGPLGSVQALTPRVMSTLFE